MQGASKALRARLPAKVRDLIVAEAAGGSLWLCKRDWRESVAMSDLRSASDQPFESSSPDKVTPSEEEAPFLYDVMRIRKGKITFEHDHFVRIRDSCLIVVNLGAKATDCDDSHLVDNAEDVSRISSCVEYVMETIKEFVRLLHGNEVDINLKFVTWFPLELTIINGPEERRQLLSDFPFAIFFVNSFFPPEKWYEEGISLALLYDAHRRMPNAKTVQASLRQRAKSMLEQRGVFEVMLVSDDSHHFLVPEGSRSNYLVITAEDKLLCSREEDILVGITLKAARRVAAAAGLSPFDHRRLFVGDICLAQSIVILGTSIGVLPVREVQFYYDSESKGQFLAAMSDYVQFADSGIRAAAEVACNRVTATNGVLRFESAQNETVKRLREFYEAEALRQSNVEDKVQKCEVLEDIPLSVHEDVRGSGAAR